MTLGRLNDREVGYPAARSVIVASAPAPLESIGDRIDKVPAYLSSIWKIWLVVQSQLLLWTSNGNFDSGGQLAWLSNCGYPHREEYGLFVFPRTLRILRWPCNSRRQPLLQQQIGTIFLYQWRFIIKAGKRSLFAVVLCQEIQYGKQEKYWKVHQYNDAIRT